MPKETGTIDLKAQKAARDDAAKYATDYITEISGDGIWVTPEDAKPVGGQATSATTGWHISDALEYFKVGASWFKLWLNTTLNKMQLRLGLESSGHVVLDDSGMEVLTDASTSVASFGSTVRVGTASGARTVTTSTGVDVYNSSNQKKASFGTDQYIYGGNGTYPYMKASSDGVRLYKDASNHADMTSAGLDVVKGGKNVASLGSTARIGASDTGHTVVSDDGLTIYNSAQDNIKLSAATRVINYLEGVSEMGPAASAENTGGFLVTYAGDAFVNKGDAPFFGRSVVSSGFGYFTRAVVAQELQVYGGGIYSTGTIYGNLSGGVTLGHGATAALNAKTPSRTGSIIEVGGGKKTAGDANGTVVRLSGGGLTLVGGGEYPNSRYNLADLDDGTERLYLGADAQVYIETNGNTIANRKTFTFDTSGNLHVPGTVKVTASGVNVSLEGHNHAASAITNLGDYLNFDLGATSVATATWKELRVNTSTARVKLPAGVWVVMVSVSFATNATGRRMVLLTTNSSAASSSINRSTVASFSIPAVTGEQTKNTVTTVVYPSAETTYYVHAYQNSGAAVNTGAYVRAVRIR